MKTVKKFFLEVTQLHGGKRCHGICESLVRGPRQDAVASWIQDPNTLGPKKFRERLVFKNSNLLGYIRSTTANAQKVGAKNPERESNYWKMQRVAGGHRKQVTHARIPNSSYLETSYSTAMVGKYHIVI